MARQEKKLPEILPCMCGDIGITLRPRGGAWSVYCLNPKCETMVRGFATERDAIQAWNEEVLKHGKTDGKRH